MIVNKYSNPPSYTQFHRIVKKFPEADKPFQNFAKKDLENMIFTWQDNCRYENVSFKDGLYAGKPNPYSLNVTEIEVGGQRLHNWLHFQITSNDDLRAKSGATGKIKMAFIVVSDQEGRHVGDFNHALPCAGSGKYQCKCKYYKTPKVGTKQCHHGGRDDHVPCMFTSDKVVSVSCSSSSVLANKPFEPRV
jgi:hypothetical protein